MVPNYRFTADCFPSLQIIDLSLNLDVFVGVLFLFSRIGNTTKMN